MGKFSMPNIFYLYDD